MDEVAGVGPQQLANGSLVESERAHMLDEALGLVVSHVTEPLLDENFGTVLLSSLVTNPGERQRLLSDAASSCRDSFVAELTHMVEKDSVISQFAKLETILDEWDPKIESLMLSNPSDIQILSGPDPYLAELEKQKQKLQSLEQKVEEYKSKILAQRETISNVIGLIHEKRQEVDVRLEGTQKWGSELAKSAAKQWSDGELRRK